MMSRRESPETRRQSGGTSRGQATVEFALVLPVVIALIALVVHITVVAIVRIETLEEARSAARSASLAEDPPSAARRSIDSDSPSTLQVTFDADTVTVVVSRHIDPYIPLVGLLTPPVEIQSRLTVAREPPSG